MTANVFEEEELIKLSKRMSEEELKYVDKSLLTYSGAERLDAINSKLDELSKRLDKLIGKL